MKLIPTYIFEKAMEGGFNPDTCLTQADMLFKREFWVALTNTTEFRDASSFKKLEGAELEQVGAAFMEKHGAELGVKDFMVYPQNLLPKALDWYFIDESFQKAAHYLLDIALGEENEVTKQEWVDKFWAAVEINK